MSKHLPYFLGCPAWSNREWIGKVFRTGTDTNNLLREYSRVFNTVEANTLFYALPPMATVERWMAESADGFRFAPKFPKAISHERRLSGADEENKAFFKVLEALSHGDKLGVSFLQLPPSFNINNLDTLREYLKSLPGDFPYAIEPRHISFYDGADNERRLDDLLENQGIDKVVFDTRPLWSSEPDEKERKARERKPQMPVRQIALGKHPIIRFVGKNKVEKNEIFIKEWASVINKWILEGKKPYLFGHAGDDAFAPFVARRLHLQLKRINPLLPELPEFESDRIKPEKEIEQLDLF
ncbi:DUF72 domain-containing protein [Pelagicoccus sp. SDUM812002]|uniref:DUF72 domain-containing protein n=1 Tax=Pelagicoccus sp. SDUM812002 TaxID=3041266 RepID=UPI00280E4430|nr:DUF72 domain-containing protein [Pelagicoccus sp. SDUM812002]MDQ8185440.1 DUF72 domain-containing protein [Pelagicoccus sp. SDUM812002]